MKSTSIIGALLCGLVLCATCSSDTTQQMQCTDPTTGAQVDCSQPVCTGTMRACRNAGANGCDTDVSNDVKNCGACDNKCPLPPHGTAVCQNSTCGVTSCEGSYADCNNNPMDGCEVDTARDPNNCGTCGMVCQGANNATGACVAGKCVLSCTAPFLDCNSDPSDGCEVNGNADLNNCGSCKNVCPTPAHGNPACAAGSCIVSVCTAPYLTCQPGPINGCETNTAIDVNNCSACGNVCPQVAHGTPACLSSACGIGSCFGTYHDCDKIPTNGCESDITSDVNNCGACGNPCPNTCTCSSSQCVQPSSSMTITNPGQNTFVVPNCVTTLTVKAWGGGGGGAGQGGGGAGGGGAFATSVLTVTPGETLNIVVGGGGGGGNPNCVANTGAGAGGVGGFGVGFGGSGGNAGPTPCDAAGGGGGGGTFVLRGSSALVVAGGGGGGGGLEAGSCGGLGSPGGGGGASAPTSAACNCPAGMPGGGAGASGSTNGLGGNQDNNDGPGAGGGGGGVNGGGGGSVDQNVGYDCDNYPSGGGGGGTSLGTTVNNGSGSQAGNANDADRGSAGNGGAPTSGGSAGLVKLSW